MKKRSILRFGAVLLSVGFVMTGMGKSVSKVALAEDLAMFGDGEEFAFTDSEEEMPETFGEQETLADAVEILLPQTSVCMPASEFLPVQKEEQMLFLKPYNNLYLLHFKSDSQALYRIHFNQTLEETDLTLYRFDSAENRIEDSEPVLDVLKLEEDPHILSLQMDSCTDYILVISRGESYPELGYTSDFIITQSGEEILSGEIAEELQEEAPQEEIVPEEIPPQETSSEEAVPSEETPSEEAVPEEIPSEETPSEEISSEEQTEELPQEIPAETVTEEPTLTSVKLNLDEGLECIPVEFLSCLDNMDVYSLSLVYSDGTEVLTDKEDERFMVSVEYTDVNGEEETVHRTYHAVVTDLLTEEVFEDSSQVVFGNQQQNPIDGMKSEEMTTVRLKGKKNWVIVQSVPSVTGLYSMKSFGRDTRNMYYAAEGSEAVRAEEVFELKKDTTYTFLIELSE